MKFKLALTIVMLVQLLTAQKQKNNCKNKKKSFGFKNQSKKRFVWQDGGGQSEAKVYALDFKSDTTEASKILKQKYYWLKKIADQPRIINWPIECVGKTVYFGCRHDYFKAEYKNGDKCKVNELVPKGTKRPQIGVNRECACEMEVQNMTVLPYTILTDEQLIPQNLRSLVSVQNNNSTLMSVTVLATQPFTFKMKISYVLEQNLMNAGKETFNLDYTIVVCGDETVTVAAKNYGRNRVYDRTGSIVGFNRIKKHFQIGNQAHPDCDIQSYEIFDSTCSNPVNHPEFSVTKKQKSISTPFSKDEMTINTQNPFLPVTICLQATTNGNVKVQDIMTFENCGLQTVISTVPQVFVFEKLPNQAQTAAVAKFFKVKGSQTCPVYEVNLHDPQSNGFVKKNSFENLSWSGPGQMRLIVQRNIQSVTKITSASFVARTHGAADFRVDFQTVVCDNKDDALRIKPVHQNLENKVFQFYRQAGKIETLFADVRQLFEQKTPLCQASNFIIIDESTQKQLQGIVELNQTTYDVVADLSSPVVHMLSIKAWRRNNTIFKTLKFGVEVCGQGTVDIVGRALAENILIKDQSQSWMNSVKIAKIFSSNSTCDLQYALFESDQRSPYLGTAFRIDRVSNFLQIDGSQGLPQSRIGIRATNSEGLNEKFKFYDVEVCGWEKVTLHRNAVIKQILVSQQPQQGSKRFTFSDYSTNFESQSKKCPIEVFKIVERSSNAAYQSKRIYLDAQKSIVVDLSSEISLDLFLFVSTKYGRPFRMPIQVRIEKAITIKVQQKQEIQEVEEKVVVQKKPSFKKILKTQLKFKRMRDKRQLLFKIAIPELNDEAELCCISFESASLGGSSYFIVPGRNVMLNDPEQTSNFVTYTGRDILISFPDLMTLEKFLGDNQIKINVTDKSGQSIEQKIRINFDFTKKESKPKVVSRAQTQNSGVANNTFELSNSTKATESLSEKITWKSQTISEPSLDKFGFEVSDVDSDGKIVILFDVALKDEKNGFDLSQINNKSLSLSLDKFENSEGDNEDVKLDWVPVSLIERMLEIQLKFSNSIALSQSKDFRDSLYVKILQPEKFQAFEGFLKADHDKMKKSKIRKQMKDGNIEEALISSSQYLSLSNKGKTLIRILINFFVALTVNYLISYIHMLQVITYQQLVNSISPANLEFFFRILIRFMTVEVLEPEWTTQQLLDFERERSLLEEEKSKGIITRLTMKLQESGFETYNPILNSGGISIVLFGFLCLAMIKYIGKFYDQIVKFSFEGGSKRVGCGKKLRKFIFKSIFGRTMFILMEAAFSLYVSVFLYFEKQKHWDQEEKLITNSVSNVYGISLAVMMFFILPTITLTIFVLNPSVIKSKRMQAYIGFFTTHLHLKDRSSSFQLLVFLGRRIVVSAIIIYLRKIDQIQILMLLYLNLAMTIQLGLSKPYASPEQNRLELFNECLVYYSTIISIVFTSYNDDKELSYVAGWFIIATISGGVLFNLVFKQRKNFNRFFGYLIRMVLRIKRCLKKKISSPEPIKDEVELCSISQLPALNILLQPQDEEQEEVKIDQNSMSEDEIFQDIEIIDQIDSRAPNKNILKRRNGIFMEENQIQAVEKLSEPKPFKRRTGILLNQEELKEFQVPKIEQKKRKTMKFQFEVEDIDEEIESSSQLPGQGGLQLPQARVQVCETPRFQVTIEDQENLKEVV